MPKEGKPKQTRKRIPRTCAQCRKRKQKCDSLKPCAVCKLRGEGDLCDYEGAQPTRVLDDDDLAATPISAAELQRLRSQLDGLESLVQQVVYKGAASNGGGVRNDGDAVIDLEEHNHSEVLQQMMATRTLIPGIGAEAPIIQKVRKQCKDMAEKRSEWSDGYLSAVGLTSSSNFSRLAASQLHDPAALDRLLPSYQQAQRLVEQYGEKYEWYHACFPRSQFEKDLDELYSEGYLESVPHTNGAGERNKSLAELMLLVDAEGIAGGDSEARCITLATLFAIARSVVPVLTEEVAKACGWPVGLRDRKRWSEEWLAASLACLNKANYEGRPRLETISCLIVLLEATWFDGPVGGLDDFNLLFDLKCKGLNLGFDLGLHRDPSHRDPSATSASVAQAALHAPPADPEHCHHRRMLWWALLSLDGLYSYPAGRVSSLVSLDGVDVYLPALSANPVQEPGGGGSAHEGCEGGCKVSSPVTGVKPRLLLGFVGYEITRLPLRRSPPTTLKDLSKAHRDLSSLEAHLPATHKLFEVGHRIDRSKLPTCSRARRDAFVFYIRFYHLLLKLHKPLHTIKRESGLPFDPIHHRYMVVHHALLLLDLRKVTNATPAFVLGCVLYLGASFSLALDLLLEPNSDEAPLIKSELTELIAFLRASEASAVRRGVCILECLLSAVGTPPPGSGSWFSADIRPVSATNWSQGPFHQPPDNGQYKFSPYDPSGAPPPQALPVFQPMSPEFPGGANGLGGGGSSTGPSSLIPAGAPPSPWPHSPHHPYPYGGPAGPLAHHYSAERGSPSIGPSPPMGHAAVMQGHMPYPPHPHAHPQAHAHAHAHGHAHGHGHPSPGTHRGSPGLPPPPITTAGYPGHSLPSAMPTNGTDHHAPPPPTSHPHHQPGPPPGMRQAYPAAPDWPAYPGAGRK